MKKWQRVLIGLLLLLNAWPFTLDRSTRGFAAGLVFALVGLAILFSALPPMRAFNWLDAIRTAAVAFYTAGVLFLYKQPVKLPWILAFAATLCLLFLPWRLRSPRRRAGDHARETLDELEAVEMISADEHVEAAKIIEQRVEDRSA